MFVRKISLFKLPSSCEVVENRWFGAIDFRGEDTPFGDAFSLPSTWPVLAEFHLASSDGIAGEIKKIEDGRRISVKTYRPINLLTTMANGLINFTFIDLYCIIP